MITVCGDGRGYAADLQALCSELGLMDAVRFAGSVTPGQLPAINAAADLVAIPSSFEGLPLVLLEAMAAGKPVVASRTSGIPDVLAHDKTGFLVDVDDVAGLVDAFATLLRSPDRAQAMGKAARAEVLKNYRWSTIAERYVDCYRSVLRDAG